MGGRGSDDGGGAPPRHGHLAALAALTTLALVLRLWALDGLPPGLDTDEASIGYNAFALSRTGRDEYGQPWPLAFRAFGEYKRPVYVYAALPSVAALGLSPFAVRFPAALAGTLSVPALYAVAALLLRGRQRALWAAGLLAVSPWHLQFSRAAREVSLLVLALLVMVAVLLAALRARPRPPGGARSLVPPGALYPIASLALLLAVYSYPGGVIVAPLLAALVLVVYRTRALRAPRLWLGAACAVLVLGALPLAQQLADGRARARYEATSVFTDSNLAGLAAGRQGRDRRDNAFGLLGQPAVIWAGQILGGYLVHFDPTFLFTRGDPEPRHRSLTGGQLHLWDLPLLVSGALLAVRHRRRPAVLVIAGWLALGALPAAFAVPIPHAVRAIPMLPAWYLLAALGAVPLWRWLTRHRLGPAWALALVLSVAVYLYGYHRYYGYEHDLSWSKGWLEVFRQAQGEVDAGRFERVVIPAFLPGPGVTYIYALFATAYDPQRYLDQGGSAAGADDGVYRFHPFVERRVDWATEPRDPHTLYLYPIDQELPAGGRPVAVVTGAGGRPVVRLIAFPSGAASTSAGRLLDGCESASCPHATGAGGGDG